MESVIVSLIIASTLAIGSTIELGEPHVFQWVDDVSIDRPLNDTRSYMFLQLDNGLKVMLISGQPTDLEYHVDVSISVGAVMHGREFPGLAHLLEHVICMQPNLSNVLGVTEELNTHYYKTGKDQNLQTDLSVLARSIFAPLFFQEYLTQSLSEVETEWKSKCSCIPNQLQQLTYSTIYDPSHPACTFKFGNAQSLRSARLDDLSTLHAEFYSPKTATVAIVSGKSLAELGAIVIEAFGNYTRPPAEYSSFDLQSPRTVAKLTGAGRPSGRVSILASIVAKTILYTTPVSGSISPEIHFDFFLPADRFARSAKPLMILEEAVGNFARGGLRDLLVQHGRWLRSLSAHYNRRNAGAHVLEVRMRLTPQAADFEANDPGAVISELARALFIFIELFSRGFFVIPIDPVVNWRQRQFDSTNFQPRQLVASVAGGLRDFPVKYAVSGPYLIRGATEELIQQYWKLLTPEVLAIRLVGDVFRPYCTRFEKWYRLPFGRLPMPTKVSDVLEEVPSMSDEVLNATAAEMGFNQSFLVSEFEQVELVYLTPSNATEPISVALPGGAQLFVDADTSQKSFTARFELSVFSPWLFEGVKNFARASVAQRCISEQLEGDLQAATNRGYSNRLVFEEDRMLLILEGPPGAISKMLDIYADAINWGDIRCRETLQRTIQTVKARVRNSNTIQQAYSTLYSLLKTPYYSDHELLAALESIDFPLELTVQPFFAQIFQEAHVRAGAGGNVNVQVATEWTNKLTAAIPRVLLNIAAEIPETNYVDLKKRAVKDLRLIQMPVWPQARETGSVLLSLQLQASANDSSRCPAFVAKSQVLLDISKQAFDEFIRGATTQVLLPTVALEEVSECSAQLHLHVESSLDAALILRLVNLFIMNLPVAIHACEGVENIAESHALRLMSTITDPIAQRAHFFNELRRRTPNFGWLPSLYENMQSLRCADIKAAALDAVRAPKIAVVILRPDDMSLRVTRLSDGQLERWKQRKHVRRKVPLFSSEGLVAGSK